MQLSVVIPVFNERDTIETLVRRVQAVPYDIELIVVDDASTDGTQAILTDLVARYDNLRYIRHTRNQGKGAALQTGFSHVGGEIVIIQDADLEYDPNDYPRLVQPILDDKADVVYGSRFAGGQSHRVLYFWHSLGNRFLTLLSNMLTDLNLTDMETCYKVFRRSVLEQITIEQNGFGIEPEITAKVAKLNCRIYEVGISYAGRTYQEGKKIRWQDGLWAVWCILKYNFQRHRNPPRRQEDSESSDRIQSSEDNAPSSSP